MINFSEKWDQIESKVSSKVSKRIATDHPLNLFIGYSEDGHRELRLTSSKRVFSELELPDFENIEINVSDDKRGYEVSLKLVDNSLKDLFSAITCDLVNASAEAKSEAAAANIFGNRIVRWAELLEEQKNGGLSFPEQLGLLGELSFIKWLLLKKIVSADSLMLGWRGPHGESRDVTVGSISVEVKASIGTQKNVIMISSLDQLDVKDWELLLSRHRFSPSETGKSLRDIVSDIEYLLDGSIIAISNFRRKLYLSGYDSCAGYSEYRFIELTHDLYVVNGKFPRLTVSNVLPGIRSVKYEIDCELLDEWRIDKNKIEGLINGRH